jgi:hypothetical protein
VHKTAKPASGVSFLFASFMQDLKHSHGAA